MSESRSWNCSVASVLLVPIQGKYERWHWAVYVRAGSIHLDLLPCFFLFSWCSTWQLNTRKDKILTAGKSYCLFFKATFSLCNVRLNLSLPPPPPSPMLWRHRFENSLSVFFKTLPFHQKLNKPQHHNAKIVTPKPPTKSRSLYCHLRNYMITFIPFGEAVSVFRVSQ